MLTYFNEPNKSHTDEFESENHNSAQRIFRHRSFLINSLLTLQKTEFELFEQHQVYRYKIELKHSNWFFFDFFFRNCANVHNLRKTK